MHKIRLFYLIYFKMSFKSNYSSLNAQRMCGKHSNQRVTVVCLVFYHDTSGAPEFTFPEQKALVLYGSCVVISSFVLFIKEMNRDQWENVCDEASSLKAIKPSVCFELPPALQCALRSRLVKNLLTQATGLVLSSTLQTASEGGRSLRTTSD